MKRILLLLFILQLTGIASAQTVREKAVAEQEDILRAGIVEIEYELVLSSNMTLVSQAGVAFSGGFGGRQTGWIFDYTPNFGVDLRYYYNLKKRAATGRNTKYYSGNYITFISRAYLEKMVHEFEKNEYFFGPAWGIQRDIGRRFQLGIQLGLGMGGPIKDLEIASHIGFNLGYRLN
ncbi:MAG TPA: hypothetical protein VF181_09335 [Balneolaceae bacterium]